MNASTPFAAVRGVGASGDDTALELHLLFEPAGEGRQHQRLDGSVGSACGGGHLVGELIGARGKLVVGHDLGDQSPLRRLLGGQCPVGQHQLLGPGDADQPGQEVGRAAVGAQPDLGVGHRERRRLGGQHQVAGDRDGETRTGGRPVDGGDQHRVHPGERRDRTVQVSATPLMCRPRLGAVANDLRSPPAQKNRPGASQHDDLRRGGVAERQRRRPARESSCRSSRLRHRAGSG